MIQFNEKNYLKSKNFLKLCRGDSTVCENDEFIVYIQYKAKYKA